MSRKRSHFGRPIPFPITVGNLLTRFDLAGMQILDPLPNTPRSHQIANAYRVCKKARDHLRDKFADAEDGEDSMDIGSIGGVVKAYMLGVHWGGVLEILPYALHRRPQ